MTVLALPCDDTMLEIRRHRRTKKMFVVVSLLACSVVLQACVSFGMLSLISGALGMLNAMGVFGDGELSEIIGMVSMVGTMVGMVGGMLNGFNADVSTLWGGGEQMAGGTSMMQTTGGSSEMGSYWDGYDAGFGEGYDWGYTDGDYSGYLDGTMDGWDAGYDAGSWDSSWDWGAGDTGFESIDWCGPDYIDSSTTFSTETIDWAGPDVPTTSNLG